MEEGALGLSSGLEYDPGIYSAPEEVVTLARVAAGFGGRYISHVRSEDREFWKALDEIIAIGRETKMPVQVSHMKLAMIDSWGKADRFISVMDRARAEGVQITGDIYPYEYWQSTLTVLFPERDFTNRKTAQFVIEHIAPADGLLISSFSPEPALVDHTVAEIAKMRGTDPAATLMALIARVAGSWRGGVGHRHEHARATTSPSSLRGRTRTSARMAPWAADIRAARAPSHESCGCMCAKAIRSLWKRPCTR